MRSSWYLCLTFQEISDGIPWCEERLVRKVLFLSLKEFRDAHHSTHKHSLRRTQMYKCKLKNGVLRAPQKTQALKRDRRRAHAATRVTQKQANTYRKKNSHISQVCPHEQTNKEQNINLSQDTSVNKFMHTQTMQPQLKMCMEKMSNGVEHTHLEENTFYRHSATTRTLRSHKTQLPNKEHKTGETEIPPTGNNGTTNNTQILLSTRVPGRTLRSHMPTSLSGKYDQFSSLILFCCCKNTISIQVVQLPWGHKFCQVER